MIRHFNFESVKIFLVCEVCSPFNNNIRCHLKSDVFCFRFKVNAFVICLHWCKKKLDYLHITFSLVYFFWKQNNVYDVFRWVQNFFWILSICQFWISIFHPCWVIFLCKFPWRQIPAMSGKIENTRRVSAHKIRGCQRLCAIFVGKNAVFLVFFSYQAVQINEFD